jgi:hypothetical protein
MINQSQAHATIATIRYCWKKNQNFIVPKKVVRKNSQPIKLAKWLSQ